MATLVLNTDAQPLSFLPLSTISWKEAITDLVLDKVVVLEWYEDWTVRSANWETRVPAVVMQKQYQRKKNTMRFSKYNVFLRDEYTCQYCGIGVTRKTATLDHVLPLSHGGKNVWENCVCACAKCNLAKGNNKQIVPVIKPYKPTVYQLIDKRKKLKFEIQHPSWLDYLQ